MLKRRKEKEIVCPRCGKRVGIYKDIVGTDSTFSCEKCKVFVIYCRDDDIVKVINDDKEKRVASSGRRFL